MKEIVVEGVVFMESGTGWGWNDMTGGGIMLKMAEVLGNDNHIHCFLHK